ncbi:MAG TPA: efflux RND transporter permease subunit [Terriglobales bacterium]|jgi:hypothetical protein|nr:efflux RND transporter permease subunit [Terriglobales bacterium]
MWIVRLALNRPYTFIVLALLILILGPVMILNTPTDIFTNINIPVIAVDWIYTGLNPEDIETRIWAVGPTFSETLFDAGRRRATTESALAGYEGTVATYRQTVLNAYQQVEDNLVALTVLNTEAAQQHSATASAEKSLQLSQNRYTGGIDTYLQVVVWQTTALTNERNDIDIMRRRLEANVLLVKALGRLGCQHATEALSWAPTRSPKEVTLGQFRIG